MTIVTRLRQAFARAGFLRIAVYLAVFLVLLEAASRYYEYGWNAFNPRMLNSVDALEYTTLVQPSRLEGVPFEFKPNLRSIYQMKPFVTNAAGIREDRDYALEKPPATFRAVVIGASNALGHGIDRRDVFDKIVERRLNGDRTGLAYEFINFSFESYDTRKCWHLLRQKALPYRPDLVLFCMPTRGELRRYLPNARVLKGESHRYNFFTCYFLSLVRNSVLFQSRQQYENVGMMPEQQGSMDTVFAQLSELQKKNGIPVCITLLRFAAGDPSETAVGQVRSAAGKYGLHFVDTWPYIDRSLPVRDYLVFGDDPHPNERAHARYAEAVYDYLRANGLDKLPMKGTN